MTVTVTGTVDRLTGPPGVFVLVVLAALLLVRLVFLVRRRMPVSTAPRRAFTGAERRQGQVWSGGRCEHKHPLWWRCRRPAEHADHIFPWSRGGWTIMSNQQSLCRTHNLRKSDRVPSRWYILRLERRRRRYYPPGVSGRVNWRPDRTR